MNAVQTKNKAYTLSISGLIPKVLWPIPIKIIDEMMTQRTGMIPRTG
jgi:hypothetical protein